MYNWNKLFKLNWSHYTQFKFAHTQKTKELAVEQPVASATTIKSLRSVMCEK